MAALLRRWISSYPVGHPQGRSRTGLSCRGSLELEQEGMRKSLVLLLGGEEWVTLAGCLGMVSCHMLVQEALVWVGLGREERPQD